MPNENKDEVSLNDLLAYSSKISQNIENDTHERGKQTAMDEYGLVDPDTVQGGKNPKANTKLQNKVNDLTTSLQLAERQVADLNELLVQKDAQIARLGEQIAALQTLDIAETPTLKVPVSVSTKPWESGV